MSAPATTPRGACRYCDGTGFIRVIFGGPDDEPRERMVRCTHRRGQPFLGQTGNRS